MSPLPYRPPRAPFRKTSVYELSAREREVASGLASGETITQIALRLGVNVSAVSNYRRHAQEKLGVYNRIQLAQAWNALAAELGQA